MHSLVTLLFPSHLIVVLELSYPDCCEYVVMTVSYYDIESVFTAALEPTQMEKQKETTASEF